MDVFRLKIIRYNFMCVPVRSKLYMQNFNTYDLSNDEQGYFFVGMCI